MENPRLNDEFCTQNESNIPHDVSLQYVITLTPVYTFNYNAVTYPKHAKEMDSGDANVKKLQKLVLNSQMESVQWNSKFQPFICLHFNIIKPSIFEHAAYLTGHKNNSSIFNVDLFQ